jgi:hypothetical protein
VILEAEVFSVFDAVALEQFVNFHRFTGCGYFLAMMIIDRVVRGWFGRTGRDFGRLANFAAR